MKKIIVLALFTTLSTMAIAEDIQVFNWKTDRGTNAYSDTPHNMQMGRSSVLNIRTGTVTPPKTETKKAAPTNLVEAQAQLNEQIVAENKRREEEAARQAAETKAENCKTARMNRAFAENARNKAELIPKFDAAINQYCN